MEVNRQITEKQIKDNLENGDEYVGCIKTPYQNLMLDIQVLRIEERLVGHISFLAQKVVRCEIWIGSFQRRHNYKQ